MNEAKSIAGNQKIAADDAVRDGERVLENAHLRVVISPDRGGKIVSLFSKRTQTEWLLPPLRPYEEAITTAGFDAWDGGGFDECLPTVSATETAPDHGEVWRHAWREETSQGAVVLHTTALAGALRFERHAWLNGAVLVLDYRVANASNTEQVMLYSAHPLLRVEEGDRIELPSEIESVCVGGSSGDRLGVTSDTLSWPKTKTGEDLSAVGPPDGLQADKLFAGPLASGWCRLFRPSLGEGIHLEFNTAVLPYLGIWICRAAWPDSGPAKQYAVAFEPTHANCDSVADAERNGTAWRLRPEERREWTLRFHLTTERHGTEEGL